MWTGDGTAEPDCEAGRTGETGRPGGSSGIAGRTCRRFSRGCRVAGDGSLTRGLARSIAGRFTGRRRSGSGASRREAGWPGASIDQDRRGRPDDGSVRCRR
jgi:hypothetical protein